MEDGKFIQTEKSTPQGALISPILGYAYLYYALDMWFEIAVKKYCKGFCGMVRYADDYVCCFEKEAEAKELFTKLQKRLQKFGLEIEVDKSKLICFGRKAGADKGKFDFLGFTGAIKIQYRCIYRIMLFNVFVDFSEYRIYRHLQIIMDETVESLMTGFIVIHKEHETNNNSA